MPVREIDVEELQELRAAGVPLIDVRQPDEYEEAHVPGAVLIPLGEVPDRLAELPTGDELLIICKSGGRSMKAAEFLGTQGIVAVNVAGGTMAWIDAGKATTSGPTPD